MQFLSLYLHIPFCRMRCTYCAFNIYTDRFHLADSYVDSLCHEAALLGQGEAVHSIYFGGGTPSLLSVQHYQKILSALHRHFDVTPDCEITLEVNPANVDQPYLEGLRSLGVNRFSIGMQSAVAEELLLFGRDHTLADVDQTVNLARAAGFDNLSFDLIYGVPHQTLADWKRTLDHALTYHPQHFSLYSLQLESGTTLTKQVKHGQLPEPDDDLAADMYELASEKLERAGLEQYEISSWGRSSRHNLQYWRNLPYLGLGAGAHGCAGGVRTVNVMRPEKYIERLRDTTKDFPYPRTAATQSYEVINRQTEMFETIMLGLRMLKEGLSLAAFEARFGISLGDLHGETISRLKQQGLLIEENNTLYLTRRARLIGNQVFMAFLPETTTP